MGAGDGVKEGSCSVVKREKEACCYGTIYAGSCEEVQCGNGDENP